jgi:hypothetical protein
MGIYSLAEQTVLISSHDIFVKLDLFNTSGINRDARKAVIGALLPCKRWDPVGSSMGSATGPHDTLQADAMGSRGIAGIPRHS